MFEAIWNCRKLFENNISKEWILTMFERIWNCREKNLKTMYLKHAFWRYWKRFGTAKKTLITRTLNGSFWRLTIVETIWNFREKIKTLSLKHALGRDVKRVGTAEKMKTRTVNGVFWRYLKLFETVMSRLVGAHSSPPLAFTFYCIFGYFEFSTFKKICRPGPTRHTRSYASARG